MEAQLVSAIKAQKVLQTQLVRSSAAFDMEDVQKNVAVVSAIFRVITSARGRYIPAAVSVLTNAVMAAYAPQVDVGASRLLERRHAKGSDLLRLQRSESSLKLSSAQV